MERWSESFEKIIVEESKLFCYPTRLLNTYEPNSYEIPQPEFEVDGFESTIKIAESLSGSLPEQIEIGFKGRLSTKFEMFFEGKTLKINNNYVYDARFMFNDNMAHLVQHHLATLGYIKAVLGYGNQDVVVVLGQNASKMVVDTFDLCGYETIKTNRRVDGRHIKVTGKDFFHYLPFVSEIEINGLLEDTPKRVYIHRKTNRRVINNTEFSEFLSDVGFTELYFEDLSIVEQWSVMKNAESIVAVHGAALGCLAFLAMSQTKIRPKLIELFGSGFVVNPFRKYMAALSGEWAGCRGQITSEVVRDIDIPGKHKLHAYDDFLISTMTVENALRYLNIID